MDKEPKFIIITGESGSGKTTLIEKLIPVFKQNEHGHELFKIWRENLIMQPTAEEGMELLAVGIREGQKRMIRGIALAITRTENKKHAH